MFGILLCVRVIGSNGSEYLFYGELKEYLESSFLDGGKVGEFWFVFYLDIKME